jgi:predicted small integral membrane protein
MEERKVARKKREEANRSRHSGLIRVVTTVRGDHIFLYLLTS